MVGRQGQLARSLAAAASAAGDIALTCIGRPELDLQDPSSIATALSARRYDVIVNAAAYTAVDRAQTEPAKAFAVNRDGAAEIAAACRRQDAALIHLSTDYVFDGRKAGAYAETDPCNPQSVYGQSKFAGEQAVLAAGGRAVILRTAWLHSPYGSNFVRTMLRLSRERDGLRVVNDQHGSPTYVPDLATCILAMARRIVHDGSADLFGTFHLAGAGKATWYEVASATIAAAAACGNPDVAVVPITTADYPTPAPRPANSVLSTLKIETVYGLRLPPWQDGVARCVSELMQDRKKGMA